MQVLIDFVPIVVFFVVYQISGILHATAALIGATAIQVAVQWFRHKTVSKMLLLTAGMVAVLGGITLALKNPLFIQWKTTVVDYLFALVFLYGAIFMKKPLVERSVGGALELPPRMWRLLDLHWAGTFAVIGTLNLYVMYNYDEETWVNFKVFGTLAITVLTLIVQVIWVASCAPRDKGEDGTEKPNG